MSILWIIAFVLLLCSIGWALLAGPTTTSEEFVAEPLVSTWDALRNYFHYQVQEVDNQSGIPITGDPGVVDTLLQNADAAIYTPGYQQSAQSLFKRLMPVGDPLLTEDEKCRATIRHPRLLGAPRDSRTDDQKREDSGCGWWFVSDPTVPSVAAFGYGTDTTRLTEQGNRAVGPAYPTALPAGGRWIWDIAEATQAEEVKRCKRINTCSLIASELNCGFCPSKGYAVPVTDGGVVKYTTDPDGNCGDANNIITDSRQCPTLSIKPRDFTGDFDYDANGNPIKNARYYEVRNRRRQTVEDPCKPIDGRITKACRLLICENVAGCAKGRGLYRIIEQEGSKLLETDRIALLFLDEVGIKITSDMWTLTSTITQDAMSATLLQLRDKATTVTAKDKVAAAALWLINETPFDFCAYADADVSAFPLECIQREFRKVGCQAAGTAYPTSAVNLQAFQGLSFGAIRTQFRDLYLKMNNQDVKNVREQDETIRQCLGVEVVREPDTLYEVSSNVCNDVGVEYWFTTIPTQNQRRLFERKVVEAATVTGELKTEFTTILNRRRGARGWTARTHVDVAATPLTLTITVPSDSPTNGTYTAWLNQSPVTAKVVTGTSNTNRKVFEIRLPQYRRSEVEVRFEGNAAELQFVPPVFSFSSGTTTQAQQPLYLPQSAWKPAVSLNATKDGLKDANRFVTMDLPTGTSTALMPSSDAKQRWAFPLSALSLKSLPVTGIWMEAVGTVALQIYLANSPAATGQVTLWKLDQGNGGTTDTVMSLQIIEQVPVFTVQSGTFIYQVRAKSDATLATGWQHLAVAVGSPLSNTRLYLAGKDVTTTADATTNATSSGTLDVRSTVFSRIVIGGVGVSGGLGWFHIYAPPPLKGSQIERDMNYDNPRISDKVPSGSRAPN